jgi:hypothetical protein
MLTSLGLWWPPTSPFFSQTKYRGSRTQNEELLSSLLTAGLEYRIGLEKSAGYRMLAGLSVLRAESREVGFARARTSIFEGVKWRIWPHKIGLYVPSDCAAT